MAAPTGPGPLAPVHRITIVTAFLGALAYLAFEVHQLAVGPDGSVLRVVLAFAAAIYVGYGMAGAKTRSWLHVVEGRPAVRVAMRAAS